VTYPAVALLFLAGAASVALLAAVVRPPGRRWWLCTGAVTAVLLVLTAIFDSLMIAADLFRFDEDRLLGLHVILAPVEDFAWPVASALALPALWTLLSPREAR